MLKSGIWNDPNPLLSNQVCSSFTTTFSTLRSEMLLKCWFCVNYPVSFNLKIDFSLHEPCTRRIDCVGCTFLAVCRVEFARAHFGASTRLAQIPLFLFTTTSETG